jgi:O-antigen ligase
MVSLVHSQNPPKWTLGPVLVFFYFLTLSMDLISVDIAVFQLKLPHVVGLITIAFLASSQRGIFLEKRYLFCFAAIFASMLLSSCFSICFYRSFIYCFILLFTSIAYFFVPVNLMQIFDENKLIKLYVASYLIIGSYAALQFFGSMVGLIMPFSVQTVIFVRGSAFAHEPSFYTLYAIPFVSFLNTKWLLTKIYNKNVARKSPTLAVTSGDVRTVQQLGLPLFLFANLFLLVSTSTTAVLSYIVLLFVIIVLKMSNNNRKIFAGLRAMILKLSFVLFLIFVVATSLFFELFKRTFFKFLFFGIGHESFRDRFTGITSAIKVFFQNPLFGLGLGGVGPYLHKEKYSPEFNQQYFEMNRLEVANFEPTNVVTEILSSLGIVGFAAFLFLFLRIGRSFQNLLNHPRISPAERINLLSILISIIVMLICLQVNQGLFRAYIWVHLGMGVGYVIKINKKLCRE